MRSRNYVAPAPLRLALPVALAATLLPSAAFAQSQDTQSVADAARRARAHKKNTEKPAKVITEGTLDVKKGDVQSATAEQLQNTGFAGNTGARRGRSKRAGVAASSDAQGSKNPSEDEKGARRL